MTEVSCTVATMPLPPSSVTLASVAVLSASRYLRLFPLWAEALLAVHQRRTVALAQGILMVRHDCPSDEAFQMLVQDAAEQNMHVHELASVLVADTAL